METYTLDKYISVGCVTASSFPEGIAAAHEQLHKAVPLNALRRFFGISYPGKDGNIIYKAAAEELYENELAWYKLEKFIIPAGEYLSVVLKDYPKDISMVDKTFKQLLADPRIDPRGFCLEWYLEANDMRCMVRLKDNLEKT